MPDEAQPPGELDDAIRVAPDRDGTHDDRSNRLLNAAVALEGEVHPESAYVRFGPHLERLPRWAAVALLVLAAGAFVTAIIQLSGRRGVGPSLLFVAVYMVSACAVAALSWAVFPDGMRRAISVVDRWGPRVFLALTVFVGLVLCVLFALGPTAEDRLSTMVFAVGALLICRVTNQTVPGQSRRRRSVHVTLALHSQRVLVGLSILAAIWALLLPAAQAAAESTGSQLAVTGSLIGAATAALGAVNRVMQRQRKVATQTVSAIDDLLAALLPFDLVADQVTRAWSALDRAWSTGVDTGVRLFATPAQTDQERALMAACLGRLTSGVPWTSSGKLQDRAAEVTARWDLEVCRASLVEHLTAARACHARYVDVAA